MNEMITSTECLASYRQQKRCMDALESQLNARSCLNKGAKSSVE